MSVLNLAALDRARLQRKPFDYLVVRDAITPETVEALNRDYPHIDKPANYAPEDLHYGPRFGELLKELDGPEFERSVAGKFGVDLTGARKTITVRRYSEPSDGHIHTDHWSKIITLLVYFNPSWDQEGGRLRMLRCGDNIEDYSAEVPPLGGTVLAFRRSGKSWHGYKRFDGERRMIQMSWIRPNGYAWYAQQGARFLTHTLKRAARVFS
jgi:SM-20-related protein